ncbi:DUF6221 family protein [Streptomyces sp. NPDC001910]|uniref:DUF6221 family protein n=1 Tax=Streptomyces sp. NPDC001910 TaxID=3154403 RepID=UPI00331671D0
MNDLVQWLGEQFDEDQRIAEAAPRGPWSMDDAGSIADADGTRVILAVGTTLDGRVSRWPEPPTVASVTAWDPARVLRETEAKRQIMECHESWVADNGDIICGRCGREHIDGRPGGHFPCQTLRLLALPYTDRPGYREEWRPS